MSDDSLTEPGLLATQTPGDNAPALSVSELSTALKRTVEGAFDHVIAISRSRTMGPASTR